MKYTPKTQKKAAEAKAQQNPEAQRVNTFTMTHKLKKALAKHEETLQCQKILVDLYRDIIKKSKDLREQTELQLEVLQKEAHIETLTEIIYWKNEHYKKYLPAHEIQMAECEANWDKYFARIIDFCNDERNSGSLTYQGYQAYVKENADNDLDVRCGYYQEIRDFFDGMDKHKKDMKVVK